MHKLPYAIRKEGFWLIRKPHINVSFTSRSNVNQWPINTSLIGPNNRKGEIGTVQRTRHYIKLEFTEGFSSVGSSMCMGIVIQQRNTF
jgi:hypothetical protein